ncbi:MAG TPA: Gfo/Idh/MocA family oxidoreductase [Actinomycetota bacterium]|nr:Gfo/Idh/MocA family oxidoreductase [Actinomycetota bacterium]
MDTVRLGVIGLGWFGGVLTESARTTGLAEVTACFARSEETRGAFAEQHGARAVRDVDEMFGDPDVEGVLIVTPHSTHADLAVRAAEAGKHVFVEKPLALTVADTKRVAEAADRAGVVVQVGHNRRRQPANRRIKSMIDGGELGTVLHLDGMHTAPGGFKPDLPPWRKDPDECPYGGMTALGVHTVDTFNYFVGPAKRLTAFSTRIDGVTDLDEATTVLIEYAAGPLGSINTTYFASPVVSLSVFGTESAVWNEEDGSRLFTQPRSDPVRSEQAVETLDTITDEMAEFAKNVRDGGRPETGISEAIEVAAVLEAIGRSVEAGSTVDVSDLR